MKNILLLFLFWISSANLLVSQDLITTTDFPGITWPFLWDMEKDSNGSLYVCSEQGILYIKTNGEWQEYDLNEDDQADARSIAIDTQGVVWIATENGLYSFSNQVIDHFTSANSGLPSDDLREIRFLEDQLWINLNGNGLAVKDGENFTHFTTSNTGLHSDNIDDIEISPSGKVVLAYDETVQFIEGNALTTYDLDNLFGFQTWVNDIFIDHNEDIWFGTRKGVIKFNNTTNQFEDLKSTYGQNDYNAILYTPNNELWLGEIFEGLHYIDNQNNTYFYDGTEEGVPSQVFDFIYYQDTVRVIGNIGATVTGLTVDISSSTNELEDNLFSVYPNPTKKYIRIQTNKEDDYSIKLLSQEGRMIFEGENVKQIDLSSFNSGTYVLQFIDKNNQLIATDKIIIIK